MRDFKKWAAAAKLMRWMSCSKDELVGRRGEAREGKRAMTRGAGGGALDVCNPFDIGLCIV